MDKVLFEVAPQGRAGTRVPVNVEITQDTTFAVFSYGKVREMTVLKAGLYEVVKSQEGCDQEAVVVLRRDGVDVAVITATHWGPTPGMVNWRVVG